jgi:hypothetical protein
MTSGNDGFVLGDLIIRWGRGIIAQRDNQADIFSSFVRVSNRIPHHNDANRLVEFVGFVPISTTFPFSRTVKNA